MTRFRARRRGLTSRRMGTGAANLRIAFASLLATVLATGVAACAAGSGGEDMLDRPEALPPGHGVLHEAEVSLTIHAGDLLVRVVPLDESVTVLTAPDTYRRLHATARRYRALLRAEGPAGTGGTGSAGREPSLFLVTLFSRSADVRYEPEALYLSSRGRRLRPVWIRPVTPGWGGGRLPQQESRSAVYGFPEEVDLADPDLVVGYGDRESDEWERILRRLEVERGRVRARAGGG